MEATIYDPMASLIVKQVSLEQEIVVLNERFIGAQNPQNTDAYQQQLHEKRIELNAVKQRLKTLRQAQVSDMEARVKVYDMQIQNCMDGFQQEELRGWVRDLNRKICELKTVIENGN